LEVVKNFFLNNARYARNTYAKFIGTPNLYLNSFSVFSNSNDTSSSQCKYAQTLLSIDITLFVVNVAYVKPFFVQKVGQRIDYSVLCAVKITFMQNKRGLD
jgi:hypothetical protein